MMAVRSVALVAVVSLAMTACAAKKPVTPTRQVMTCQALSDHIYMLVQQDGDNAFSDAEQRARTTQLRDGCRTDDQLQAFPEIMQCIEASTTPAALAECQALDADGQFSEYMTHIIDAGAPTIEVPTCSGFSSTMARLRHLELDDVSELEGDALAQAHADIDASMPSFERACEADNRLPLFVQIVDCLANADSEQTVDGCTGLDNADAFGEWLGVLIRDARDAQ